MKKQIGIMKEVYDDLKQFRDKNDLPSFTEAIRELLQWRRKFDYGNMANTPLRNPGEAQECTYEFEHGSIGLSPLKLKKLLRKGNSEH